MSSMNDKKRKRRLACVVQRYGVDVGGGSEELCRAVAERLALHSNVDVITTCARDYVTWKNELAEGSEEINGVTVRRFKVDAPRVQADFDTISGQVLVGPYDADAEDVWMRKQGPYSSRLLKYIADHSADYDAFLFFTYLYCTTYYGLPLVPDKAVLIPTAHDEPPVYLSIFDRLFGMARNMVFLTPEERDFVLRRFCLDERGVVAGTGLNLEAMSQPAGSLEAELPPHIYDRLRGKPYLLYVGRIDEAKGCRTLIDWFRMYCERHTDADLHLVLAGRGVMKIPEHKSIIATGYLSESQKLACMDHALAVVAPSPYESLCISILEAWMRRKAVLANGACAVLAGQCRRSNGGLWYRDVHEFSECLSMLVSNAQLRQALGESGHAYVRGTYRWDKVENTYLSAIEAVIAAPVKGNVPVNG